MPFTIHLPGMGTGTTFLALLLPVALLAVHFLRHSDKVEHESSAKPQLLRVSNEAAVRLAKSLSEALPNGVIHPEDAAFELSLNKYWAKQACEQVPTCVIQPQNVEQLSTAVKVLAAEYEYRKQVEPIDSDQENSQHVTGIFAIRSGGHSPVARAASIQEGVLIDMGVFCQVTPFEDMKSVVVGTGARWGKIYEELNTKGLAVVVGRNSDVRIGGLTLGGGISFFSPCFGFVCSNILSYEVVLADGSIVTASATSHPDLWCALKGGGNTLAS
jgi:FAD/FMN-containing dehydrogenase